MSRPHKAVVDYFPHYVSHGKTMFTIESKFGNDGYAFWFKLLEILGSTEHHFINCNDVESWEFLLAKTRFNEINATEILNLLSKLDAINADLWKYKIIRSQNFIDNLYTVYSRRQINVISNSDLLDYCLHNDTLSGVSVNINPQSKVKESKVKESKGEDIPHQPFSQIPVKPTDFTYQQTIDEFLVSQAWMEGLAMAFKKDYEFIKTDSLDFLKNLNDKGQFPRDIFDTKRFYYNSLQKKMMETKTRSKREGTLV